MHLKSITLKNFRCFDELHLELHPRLTVLVADNGGGKTSVLDAIAAGLSPVLRYFSTADQRLSGRGIADRDLLLFPVEDRRDRELPLFPVGDHRDSERWMASAYTHIFVETTRNMMWDVYRSSVRGRQMTIRVRQGELKDYCNAVLDSLKSENREPLPIFAYYGARRGWIQKRSSESKVDYTQPTSALVGALESLGDFTEMLKWFYLEENFELRKNKGRTPENFSESPALFAVRTAIKRILEDHYTEPHFNSKNQFVVKEKDGPQELQISQLSQGYQSMFALAMDFARRLAIGNSHMFSPEDQLGGFGHASAIMLVDEIDLHLHPSWQQRVLSDLTRTFPNTQFIVTTHSPQVLTTVKNESIRILAKDHEDKWMAITPAEQTRGVESADALHSAMGVNPVPPVEEAEQLDDYRALIENGKHETQQGQSLRKKLVQHFGADHPLIRDCDRLIRFQEFKRRQS